MDFYSNPESQKIESGELHQKIEDTVYQLNIWRSVNDIQVQAGEEGFKRILDNSETILQDYQEISVPYKSRAWTIHLKYPIVLFS